MQVAIAVYIESRPQPNLHTLHRPDDYSPANLLRDLAEMLACDPPDSRITYICIAFVRQ